MKTEPTEYESAIKHVYRLDFKLNHRAKIALANLDIRQQDFNEACINALCDYSEGRKIHDINSIIGIASTLKNQGW
jgi:hypothetical protein